MLTEALRVTSKFQERKNRPREARLGYCLMNQTGAQRRLGPFFRDKQTPGLTEVRLTEV